MAPLRGWGPKGKRLRGLAPHGHWRTLTFLGALRCGELQGDEPDWKDRICDPLRWAGVENPIATKNSR
jgi:hypothetical protein